jgi:putative Mn2+ efflux pump MntP
MEIQPVIEFFIKWACAPASGAIGYVVYLQKKKGFLDFGKFRWVTPIVYGIIFGIVQKLLAPELNITPIQSEWVPAIFMGLCTGILATWGHTIGKNTKQAVKNGGKNPPRVS